jgi:UDP-glucose 4-epimerase
VVTGASGFLGRSLVAALTSAEAEVLGVDRLAPEPQAVMPLGYRHLAGSFAARAEDVIGFLKRVPAEYRLVYHLAGIAHAGECEEEPELARKENIELTGAVVQALEASGGGRIVFPSSGSVYGDRNDEPVTEEAPLRGASVYAKTKIEAEAVIRSRAGLGRIGALILRLSNMYGAGIRPETVVGRILGQAAAREPIRVRDESPVRDFIHCADVVAALLEFAGGTPLEGAETYNLSSGVATSIGDLVGKTAELFKLAHLSPEITPQKAARRSYLVMSNERLKRNTGWEPRIRLCDGLRRSVMEMRNHGR